MIKYCSSNFTFVWETLKLWILTQEQLRGPTLQMGKFVLSILHIGPWHLAWTPSEKSTTYSKTVSRENCLTFPTTWIFGLIPVKTLWFSLYISVNIWGLLLSISELPFTTLLQQVSSYLMTNSREAATQGALSSAPAGLSIKEAEQKPLQSLWTMTFRREEALKPSCMCWKPSSYQWPTRAVLKT